MPERDGCETARGIRAQWRNDEAVRPRIAAMTGNVMPDDRDKCLAAGKDGHSSKPVRLGDPQAALGRRGAVRSGPA